MIRFSRIEFVGVNVRLAHVDGLLRLFHLSYYHLAFHNPHAGLRCECQFYRAADLRCVFDI